MSSKRLSAGIGWALALALACAAAQGCSGAAPAPARSPAEQVREQGPRSSDPEVVADWLIAELISPKGDTARAQRARKRLDELSSKGGLHASLARALDDDLHGRPVQAAASWLEVVRAARDHAEPVGPLAAWVAAERMLVLREAVSATWEQWRPVIESLIESPGSIGWRARADLVELWSAESVAALGTKAGERAASWHGCQTAVRLAGPFGKGSDTDFDRAFEAEKPGVWPLRFAPDPQTPRVVPHLHKLDKRACDAYSSEPVLNGVYYGETFLELAHPTEVLIAVQGARAVLVDDVTVLERSPRRWGTWPRFGVHLRLDKGRHRIVARLDAPRTSIRLLRPDGTALGLTASDDPGGSYVTRAPVVVSDPNVLDRFLRGTEIVRDPDDLTTWLAGHLAQVEGQHDVSSVLLEPLVGSVHDAAPGALWLQASAVQSDPIFPAGDARDLARELNAKIVAKDPEVWQARLWLAQDGAEKKGLAAVAKELRDLYDHFREVPEIGSALAAAYNQLSWQSEESALVKDLAARFARKRSVLRQLVGVLEQRGQSAEADKAAERLVALDPDSDIQVDRALRRRDYDRAVKELERLAARRPDRKEIAAQLQEVLARAGRKAESFELLEKALAKKPRDEAARLALADARLASGDLGALRKAVADAIQSGSRSTDLTAALELLEGRTELEPYRLDARKVIDQFVKAGGEMAGNAVRVLDYGVVWVNPDGSSRMLEHEIIRVQSQEAVQKLAEQNMPRGLVLRARVIKADGKVLEPEIVAGKPTVTMPHLEVGDYIETESIFSEPGDAVGGVAYLGPHWFFREQDIGYWRSEFVVISPKDRPLTVESHGNVPQPTVTEDGMLTTRRWVVDKSPAAVIEPGTVPIRELLPSVRVGWGINLDKYLRNRVETAADRSVRDPRLQRIARRIVQGVPDSAREEQARRIYRWVLSNVEKGQEGDGRKIVIGKSGEPAIAFLYLVRLLGIPAEIVVAKDRLAEPPAGPIAEAELYNDYVIRLQTEKGERFLTVLDKFAPFGYVPAELRGQPGFRLVEGMPKVVTSTEGSFDGIVYEGTATMRDDGTAEIDLAERFVGKYGIVLRRSLETVPEAQLRDAIEGKLLAADLPGASLKDVTIEDKDDLDRPLTLKMKAVSPDFARRRAGGLAFLPPFRMRVGKLASLPERKTTMILPDASHMEVRFRVKLPPRGNLDVPLVPGEFRDEDRVVIVKDRLEGRDLVIDRVYDIPAGR
ncbi:MAG TPA: hypothetical protein PLI95_07725, partial [Polyangiaceae bacterium]|nr:hypothetical protein [Polyangiaceae bacterium]